MRQQNHYPRKSVLAVLLLAGLLPMLVSCARPAPPPKAPGTGAIGISVEKHWKKGIDFTEFADKVYFVRLGENTKLEKQTELFHSNFRRGRQVYLLNAKPGRYVVVAVSEALAKPGITKGLDPLSELDQYEVVTTYFNKALVMKTEVKVAPERIVVVGDFVVWMENGIAFGDKTQRHFYQVVNPTVVDPYGSPIIASVENAANRGSLKDNRSGRNAEMRFLQAAKKDLADSDWLRLVQRRIGALNGS